MVFFVRSDLHRAPGGDTVQIDTTAAALRERGVDVCVTSDPDTDLSEVHLAHLWHLERLHESYPFMRAARLAGLPIALSPIYYPASEQPRPHSLRRGGEDLKNLVRFCLPDHSSSRRAAGMVLLRGWARCRRELLSAADMLLPNSQAEADILRAESERSPRVAVVLNVLTADVFQQPEFPSGARKGIVSVGHFDPRKNQLLLIEALRTVPLDVTFIGAARPRHRIYYRRCVAAAGRGHHFVGPLPRPEILARLSRAQLHVCPSLLETPGLANLEAAALGCQLVLPNCRPVREYFGESAYYFTPGDAASLHDAVCAARHSAPDPELRREIRRRCTSQALADATLQAYASLAPHRFERLARDKQSGEAPVSWLKAAA